MSFFITKTKQEETTKTQFCWDNEHKKCPQVSINGECDCICHWLAKPTPKEGEKSKV